MRQFNTNASVNHKFVSSTQMRQFNRRTDAFVLNWRVELTHLCWTDVWNWLICVELTCGTDAFVFKLRVELMNLSWTGVWNWRIWHAELTHVVLTDFECWKEVAIVWAKSENNLNPHAVGRDHRFEISSNGFFIYDRKSPTARAWTSFRRHR